MRTDCTRDKRTFKVPRLATGPLLSTWKAKPGDFVSYRETYTNETFHYRTARVIGRVKCEGDTFLEVVAFEHAFQFGYVRWLQEDQIVEITPCEKALAFLAKVIGPNPPTIDADGWPIGFQGAIS